MKFSIATFFLLSVAILYGGMSPADIARELRACPSYVGLRPEDRRLLIAPLLKIAECESSVIRDGLKLYDEQLQPNDEEEIAKWFYTRPVLFAVLFEYPKGPAKSYPKGRIGYLRYDGRDMNLDEEIEYCVPIEVTKDGQVTLAYEFKSYEGRSPWKESSVAIFDRLVAKYPRRKVDFQKRPNQALQHNDPSCHAPCIRTCRASRGRG